MTTAAQSNIIQSACPRVELAAREHGGVSVTLLWSPATNLLAVAVVDSTGGDSFELVLSPDEHPLDVFHHPYAHAAARGLEFSDDRREAGVTVDV